MKTNQSLIASAVAAVVAFDAQTVKYNDSRELMGKSMCAILPLEIPYDEFIAVRDAWKKAYNGATDNANDQAWSRAVGNMNGYLIAIKAETFTAPKATSDKATAESKRREERATKAQALAETVKTDKDRAAIAKRAMAGDKVAEQAIAFLGKKAVDEQRIKTEGIRKSIREALKDADLNRLQQVAKILGL